MKGVAAPVRGWQRPPVRMRLPKGGPPGGAEFAGRVPLAGTGDGSVGGGAWSESRQLLQQARELAEASRRCPGSAAGRRRASRRCRACCWLLAPPYGAAVPRVAARRLLLPAARRGAACASADHGERLLTSSPGLQLTRRPRRGEAGQRGRRRRPRRRARSITSPARRPACSAGPPAVTARPARRAPLSAGPIWTPR